MRIDILTSNPIAVADPGGAKPDCEKAPEGGSFLAVMGQMTAPEEIGSRAEAENAPSQVENEEDHRDGDAAASDHPFMTPSGNLPEALESTSASAPAAPPVRCAGPEAGMPAGDAIPDLPGPAIAPETHTEARPNTAGKPISGPACDTANPDSVTAATAADSSSGDAPSAVFAGGVPEKQNAAAKLSRESVSAVANPTTEVESDSSSGNAPSAVFAGGVPEKQNAAAKLSGESVSAVANPATELESPPQPARTSDSDVETVGNKAEVAPVTLADAPAAASTDGIMANPSRSPAHTETGRLSAHAREDTTTGTKSAGEPAAAILPLAEVTADADLSIPFFAADAIAQVKTGSALAGSGVAAGRGNPKEARPASQRAQTVDEHVALRITPGPAPEIGRTHAESALGAGVSRREQPQERFLDPDAAVKTMNGASAKETSARRRESSKDTFEPGWAETQISARVTSQNSTARPSSADVPVLAAARLWSRTAATMPASWEAGFQLPHQAAGTDLKSVLALLAPRQSAPATAVDFLSQLAGRIQMQLRDHQNILTIQLKPSALGRMEIKAAASTAGVLATILTESASVKDFLEHNLSQLQQSFQEQGLKIERISVEVQEGIRQQPSSAGQQEARSSGGRHDDPGLRTVMGGLFREPEEEIVLDVQTLLSLKPHSTFHVIA